MNFSYLTVIKMKEIIMPSTSTSTVANLPPGYQRYAIPDSMQDKDQISLFSEQVQAVVTKQIELEETIKRYSNVVNDYTNDLKKQTNRNIEVIGIFSSVIALLIINVNIINTANSFLKAILLIVSLTSSISIFAILIHSFFENSEKVKLTKYFWIPFTLLILLVAFGILAEIFNWKIIA